MSLISNPWLEPIAKRGNQNMMEVLFSRLNGIYPNRWRASFRDDAAIRDWEIAWSEYFIKQQITPQEVSHGLDNCLQAYDWPPSLPEFLKACRSWADPEASFYEAVAGIQQRAKGEMGQWSHPAIFHAAITVGAHDLLNNGYQILKTRWTNALEFQLKQQSWYPIPEPAQALPAPVEKASKDIQAAAIRAITPEKRDPRAWARKILDNPKGKSPAVINMAKAALENVAA